MSVWWSVWCFGWSGGELEENGRKGCVREAFIYVMRWCMGESMGVRKGYVFYFSFWIWALRILFKEELILKFLRYIFRKRRRILRAFSGYRRRRRVVLLFLHQGNRTACGWSKSAAGFHHHDSTDDLLGCIVMEDFRVCTLLFLFIIHYVLVSQKIIITMY